QTVEPVFGQIKDARGCDGFMRRGKDASDSEWKLMSLTHNLLKLWRHSIRATQKTKEQALMDGGKAILELV
ncbi:MAG: transposase, partial [Actinomycetota bacterium]|nr:transposase [Actinomycetota bacterium]